MTESNSKIGMARLEYCWKYLINSLDFLSIDFVLGEQTKWNFPPAFIITDDKGNDFFEHL